MTSKTAKKKNRDAYIVILKPLKNSQASIKQNKKNTIIKRHLRDQTLKREIKSIYL